MRWHGCRFQSGGKGEKMAKLSIPIQVNGLEVLRKWMDDHEIVRMPDETEEHHAGYLECWQHIRDGLDRLIDEDGRT